MAGDAVALAVRGEEARPTPARATDWPTGLGTFAVVALAASPIVVAALSLIGDSWFPVGDWAGLVFRTSQVGTRDTPLVGFDSVKGWAHPGPLLFWLAAPLYRLTGGDPRSLAWTAGILNALMVGGLGVVAWRRGRWPLLLATMVFLAVLLRGISPERTVDLWVSHLPLLAFLLTIFLAWDISLGRPGGLVAVAAVASFTAQTHLAYVSLNGLVAVWLLAWILAWPRLLPAGHPATVELPRAPWDRWWVSLRRALVLAVALWTGPLLDAVFDLHNPWNIARSFGAGASRVGLVQAIGLVGRYVRPDGPWLGGSEPTGGDFLSVQGSGVLPVLVALGALVLCLRIGRRRVLPDVVALATLSLTLVIGAVPAAGQIPLPNEAYYTQWLKLVGGIAWFTVAWTGWRLAAPAVQATPVRRLAAGGLACAGLLVATASSWGEASSIDLPLAKQGTQVQALVRQLDGGQLPRNQVIRVVRRGEFFHVYGAAVTNHLIEAGYQVVTDEGRSGLKWGHSHRWRRGDDYDLVVTVALNRANDRCARNPGARRLASYDGLSPAERAWLTDVQFRRLGGQDAVSPADRRRAEALAHKDLRLGIYAGRAPCTSDPRRQITRTSDSSILPVGGAVAGLGLVAVGGRHVVRRRRRSVRWATSSEMPGRASSARSGPPRDGEA